MARRRGPTKRRARRPATRRPQRRDARRGPSRPRPERAAEPPPPREEWIGILARRGKRARVTPYRDDAVWAIGVSPGDLGGAASGDVVRLVPVERKRGRTRRRPLPSRGRVVEVLGRPGDAEADFHAVVWRHGLPLAFPPAALAEAEALGPGVDAAARARRIDLCDRPFVTIDPESARDHDDAVCVEPAADGRLRLLVAIADVSHYVAPGSAIDREALRRGNSVYFPDRAIPMLPERLASDLCSLRPQQERLVLTVELHVDGRGRVRRRSFFPAVIRSRARLAYGEAARAMEGEGGLGDEIEGPLGLLRDLAETLRRRRLAGGSIDLDLPSAEVVMGADGRPAEIVEAPRSAAHRAVEEAMLAANRAVAEALVEARVPAIFRNHEAPLDADLEELHELFTGLGLFRGPPRALCEASALAAVLDRVRGRPEERLVNQVVLRAMRQARYGAESRGHFALAFAHYLHFTSPIRRYADLVVHRSLRAALDGDALAAPRATQGSRRPPRAAAALPDSRPRKRAQRSQRAPSEPEASEAQQIAERVSVRERLAMEAEREMLDLKRCAFMAGRVGREYAGHVSGVAPHGLYVTLDESFVDGLVHVSRLPGALAFDARARALVARRGRARFRLGDPVRVRVASVDPVKAHINFELVNGRRRGSSQRISRS